MEFGAVGRPLESVGEGVAGLDHSGHRTGLLDLGWRVGKQREERIELYTTEDGTKAMRVKRAPTGPLFPPALPISGGHG